MASPFYCKVHYASMVGLLRRYASVKLKMKNNLYIFLLMLLSVSTQALDVTCQVIPIIPGQIEKVTKLIENETKEMTLVVEMPLAWQGHELQGILMTANPGDANRFYTVPINWAAIDGKAIFQIHSGLQFSDTEFYVEFGGICGPNYHFKIRA
jgi:hypothetical protein